VGPEGTSGAAIVATLPRLAWHQTNTALLIHIQEKRTAQVSHKKPPGDTAHGVGWPADVNAVRV